MKVEINQDEVISVGNDASLLPEYKYLEDLLKRNRYISREEYMTILEDNKN